MSYLKTDDEGQSDSPLSITLVAVASLCLVFLFAVMAMLLRERRQMFRFLDANVRWEESDDASAHSNDSRDEHSQHELGDNEIDERSRNACVDEHLSCTIERATELLNTKGSVKTNDEHLSFAIERARTVLKDGHLQQLGFDGVDRRETNSVDDQIPCTIERARKVLKEAYVI